MKEPFAGAGTAFYAEGRLGANEGNAGASVRRAINSAESLHSNSDFNRKDVLVKAIGAHLTPSAIDEIREILVVDDGSTDGTDCALSRLAAEAPFPLPRLYQSKRGQAAARNLGISEATGEIILFT